MREPEVLEGACSILEGRGILEKPLAVFWWGACSVLEGRGILEKPLAVFWWGACSVLEGRGILEKPLGGRLQCFGGVLVQD